MIVRKWAFTTSFKTLPEDNGALLARAAKDSYAPIRRFAFEVMLEQQSKLHDLMPFLFDRSTSIRRACQSALSEGNGHTPADLYRAAIDSPIARKAELAVIGLAETGNGTDRELIAKLSASESGKVRRAVVRALHILGVDGYVPLLRCFLASDIPSVAKEAGHTLLLAHVSAVDDLWAAALENPYHSVRLGVLRMMRTVGKWQRLKLYFEAIQIGDRDLAGCAIGLIARWLDSFNSTFIQPSPAETRVLTEKMESVYPVLPLKLASEVEFILRTSTR